MDRSAPYVVGGYLADKPRKILYKLARSANPCERRTAIVSTYFFIRQNDLDDTFAIAEILVGDKEEVVQKAVGSWVREAGKRDPQRLRQFLDRHAAAMPRTILRYAIEKLGKAQREHYLGLKAKQKARKRLSGLVGYGAGVSGGGGALRSAMKRSNSSWSLALRRRARYSRKAFCSSSSLRRSSSRRASCVRL